MFLENVYKGKSDAWRYIVGVFLIILIYFLASMPFGVALIAEAGAEKLAGMSETEMLSVLEPNTPLFYMLLPFVFSFFWDSYNRSFFARSATQIPCDESFLV